MKYFATKSLYSCFVGKANMFGLFKRKTVKEKLEAKYEKLLHESFLLSKTNRSASDAKIAEAEEIKKKINELTD